MNHSATLSVSTPAAPSTSKLAFARHYGEMVLVMFLGMVILGGLTELGLALAGRGVDDLSGGLHISLTAMWMTVPMVAWMAYRGHTTAQNAEMAGSMIVPSILAAILTWAGAIELGTGLALQHAIMLPAMLAVMFWRYDEYAHKHRAPA
jgi:hypothetical protein